MKFSHCEEVRDERLLDLLTDEERGLRIIVSRLGAELVSLARRDANGNWIGFLYRDNEIGKPASGWGNHATVMGYFLHRLKDEHSLYRGREIRGGTHSFLRHKLFTEVSVDLGAGEARRSPTTSRLTKSRRTNTRSKSRLRLPTPCAAKNWRCVSISKIRSPS